MDEGLWMRWEADWRRMEAIARRRGWEVTPLAVAPGASAAALRRLEAAAGHPVPPQLRAVLRRSARVAFAWHVLSHLQAMERERMPTSSAIRGALWDIAQIEETARGYIDWRDTLAEEEPPEPLGFRVEWRRLFPFYTLANGDVLAIDAAPEGPQPVRYVSHELDMLHGSALAPDFFSFVTEMSKLGFAGTEWASWLPFGVRDGERFHLRADSEGGRARLAWLERDPAVPAADEPPPSVVERSPADRALLIAARADDPTGVRAALAAGAVPDATWNDDARMEFSLWNDEHATALTYAVRHGSGAMMEVLLERGASPDTRRLAVGDAVEAGPPEVLTRLLARGARVNGWKGDRHWPLHLLVTRRGRMVAPTRAALEERLRAEEPRVDDARISPSLAAAMRADAAKRLQERLGLHLTPEAYLTMLKALLVAGADPDARWDNGATMLMHGDAETVRVLLRHGADVKARASSGGTALHGVASPEVARLLVVHGADVNAPALPEGDEEGEDERGETPLQTALLLGYRGTEMPRLLIELGADPRRRDARGWSSLFYCTDVEGFRLLEPYGLDPLERLADGTTLLHNLPRLSGLRAAFPREVAVLDHLLSLGLDINAADTAGRTMLHVAAERMENPDDIQMLLDRGADPTIRDAGGRRPKDLVRRSLPEVRAVL